MANDALGTYLNDHLAGSVIALELLGRLETEVAGTPDVPVIASLRANIEEDRERLERLLDRLAIPESKPRQLTAWLTEKLAEVKLRVDDPGHGALLRLEALETVSLGIEGKRSLAHTLAAVAGDIPALAGFDADLLARRAEDQRGVIETLRLQAAKDAFVGAG